MLVAGLKKLTRKNRAALHRVVGVGVKMNELQGAFLYWLQSPDEAEILRRHDTSPIIITFRVVPAISNLNVTNQLKSGIFLNRQKEARNSGRESECSKKNLSSENPPSLSNQTQEQHPRHTAGSFVTDRKACTGSMWYEAVFFLFSTI
jgi:hypothetical protein